MPEQFFHGVSIVEVTSGPKQITTASTGVIGIVGTAPDSVAIAPATLSTGTVASNNALTFTAATPGALGNNISIRFINPGIDSATINVLAASTTGPVLAANGMTLASGSASLNATVVSSVITVSLATDTGGNVTSTASQVLAALAENSTITALVTTALTAGSNGSGAVAPFSQTYLQGGTDEAFPLNTPTLIAGSLAQAAQLGTAGTLPQALTDILNQTGAAVVVVRVAPGISDSVTQANVIGGVDTNGHYTGMSALLGAQSALGVKPRILIAPGFTQNANVLAALNVIAIRMSAIVFADGPNTTDAAAIQYANTWGYNRVMMIDPGVLEYANGVTQSFPASAIAAGLQALSDNTRGFWWSLSNQVVDGIIGTTRNVDYALNDPNCRANILNNNNVSTIINLDGYRFWGNRALDGGFLCVRRTLDIVEDSILQAHLWAVDRGITKTYLQDVANSVNAYLKTLINLGAILGGTCWADPDLNSPDQIAQGKAYWNFSICPTYPCENPAFSCFIDNSYISELTTTQSN